MTSTNALGEYLRSRRELVRPQDVGLPAGGRRRVAGLRREELAMLAGISADYYLRLEQGRGQRPSAQVLDALARVLQLDADSTAYLHELAAPKPRRRARRRTEQVPVGIAQMIDQMPLPAFVQNKYLDVLAANALGRALSPSYHPGTNLLRAVFLDPAERDLHQDWDRATADAVAGLRAVSATDVEDPYLAALVGDLSLRSERFRRLWARHDVHKRVGGTSSIKHPEVGLMHLRHEKLAITGTDGQLLVIYHAEPHTAAAQALALLGSIAASAGPPATPAVRDSATRT
ncbi:helix-turn-helix transcriptional regulator [Micromonospora sp. WMMD1120]|uniref:helix-turn-helix transcriptional regulator n=1 Tax=Micromonospora sp. WMMD1120 TaxID=3016106 RepID=UPI0024179746|nr:helix-turn-helix transcriptional regulator [Micromonospora sp. WMMD1120]MDG4809365.1 helix-turn-helix transcriptional regulator [Micromonospora sp. WMMD1120]